ncbi:hypothetical protein KC878_00890 [Candidatus Saccharibacteria bacterium]|nr:hypothetical protein [Candidatus Saccharibacteria bacterium]MCB9821493.1 hypothetical protein [Candidatus Nomurabacteria bacterium]
MHRYRRHRKGPKHYQSTERGAILEASSHVGKEKPKGFKYEGVLYGRTLLMKLRGSYWCRNVFGAD